MKTPIKVTIVCVVFCFLTAVSQDSYRNQQQVDLDRENDSLRAEIKIKIKEIKDSNKQIWKY
jgi:hypothetical protein